MQLNGTINVFSLTNENESIFNWNQKSSQLSIITDVVEGILAIAQRPLKKYYLTTKVLGTQKTQKNKKIKIGLIFYQTSF